MRIDWIVERCNEVLFGIMAEKDPLTSLTAKELDRILSETARHGMLPVVVESLTIVKKTEQDKKNVLIKWYGASELSKKKYWKLLALMEQLALQFKGARMDVMFMKGATNALWYPDPQLRVFSDIDYYLFGESMKGVKELEKIGVKTKEFPHHHTRAYLDGILLENHYDFLDRKSHQSNYLLDDELKKLADKEGRKYSFRFENKEIDNAYCMSPTMNALFLMRHMSCHFVAETMPLRMLYDWALFLRTHAKDVDWERVDKLYMASGMTEFVGIVQGLLQKYFQVEIPLCPVKPLLSKKTEKVWKSIACPPKVNPYKKKGWLYYLYEAKVFLANRWKHQIVYPGESYVFLFVRYSWSAMKRKLKTN